MPRNPLLRLSETLCALLALACIALIVFSRISPNSDRISQLGLGQCNGMPCFRGMVPGQTSWVNATAAFGGRSLGIEDAVYAEVDLFASAQNDMLDSIMLAKPIGVPMTVGEIMTLYGMPSCVQTFQNSDVLTLHFQSVHVLARIFNHQFSPFSHIMTIVLGNPGETDAHRLSPACDPIPSGGVYAQNSQRSWQGFASLQHSLSGK